MKIFSKFHDYYDIGLSQGQDETLVYSRITKYIVEEDPSHFYYHRANKHNLSGWFYRASCYGTYLEYSSFVVGFCGKLYLCFELKYHNTYDSKKNCKRYCYSPEQIEEFVSSLNDEPCSKFYEKEHSNIWYNYNFTLSRDCVDKLYEKFYKIQDNHMEYFRKFNAPTFSVYHGFNPNNKNYEYVFTVNPCLKDYQFQRVFDSYRAFQEISMFLGGVLGRGEKETLGRKDFPDEPLIRDSKGFDKWSFKKRKQP